MRINIEVPDTEEFERAILRARPSERVDFPTHLKNLLVDFIRGTYRTGSLRLERDKAPADPTFDGIR